MLLFSFRSPLFTPQSAGVWVENHTFLPPSTRHFALSWMRVDFLANNSPTLVNGLINYPHDRIYLSWRRTGKFSFQCSSSILIQQTVTPDTKHCRWKEWVTT
jgi:hypothetical protein